MWNVSRRFRVLLQRQEPLDGTTASAEACAKRVLDTYLNATLPPSTRRILTSTRARLLSYEFRKIRFFAPTS